MEPARLPGGSSRGGTNSVLNGSSTGRLLPGCEPGLHVSVDLRFFWRTGKGRTMTCPEGWCQLQLELRRQKTDQRMWVAGSGMDNEGLW